MNRITFLASGQAYEYVSDKEFANWQNRCNNYGYPFQIEMDGRNRYLLINDNANPFFKPKRKPAAVASE